MADTKVYFDQILENQNKLAETITEYVNEMVDAFTPDAAFTEKTESLVKEMVEAPVALAEELTQKENIEKFQDDFAGAYTANMQKSMDLWKDLYEKSTAYAKDTWTANSATDTTNRFKKMGELYQNCLKAMVDTTTANTKVMKEYLK
jgi:uncharacterized protein YfbU (UPF0304 family)